MLWWSVILTIFTLTIAEECKLSEDLKVEIQSYQPVVDQIIDAIYKGPRKGVLYEDLADFVDSFGPRLAGSDELERAIDDVITRQDAANLTTSTHEVTFAKWSRGEESAFLVEPTSYKLNILGLGNSASTPPGGITAQVVVITSFDELQDRKEEVTGNIVLFNVPFVSYGTTGQFRTMGPSEASKLGAVATLVRSITPFSLDSPHTGATYFDENPIPAAAITLEGADLVARFVARGKKVTIHLTLESSTEEGAVSRNVIADIPGASKPDEYVVISGHIDSWDVGQGAMDDAGGAFLAWHSLALINELGLKPARTLRSILWTGEETGVTGATAYRKEREEEARNWTVAFESDMGVFAAKGITISGSVEAGCIMSEITSLLGAVNGTQLNRVEGSVGSDISSFEDLGVPRGEPYLVPNDYFWCHHSKADTAQVLKSTDLDQNLAIFASVTYILADLSIPLPKTTTLATTHAVNL